MQTRITFDIPINGTIPFQILQSRYFARMKPESLAILKIERLRKT